MPEFRKIESLEMRLTSSDDREFVSAAHEIGRFVVLDPLDQRILELAYLGEQALPDEEIGKLLEPPRSVATVRARRSEAIRSLMYTPVRPIDSLGLSHRARNALLRQNKDVTPEMLMQMSEEELLGLRNFGRNSLAELQTKLSSYFNPDQSNSRTDSSSNI